MFVPKSATKAAVHGTVLVTPETVPAICAGAPLMASVNSRVSAPPWLASREYWWPAAKTEYAANAVSAAVDKDGAAIIALLVERQVPGIPAVCSVTAFVVLKRPLYEPLTGRNGFGMKLACTTMTVVTILRVRGFLLVVTLPVQFEKTYPLLGLGVAFRAWVWFSLKVFPVTLGITVPKPFVMTIKLLLPTGAKFACTTALVVTVNKSGLFVPVPAPVHAINSNPLVAVAVRVWVLPCW